MTTLKSFEKKAKYEIEYEFHKWKNQLLIVDKVVSIIIVLFLGLFSPDYVMISAYVLLIPYLILTQRKVLFYHFIVASLLALIWMITAKNYYGYNLDFMTVMGINLYPLFALAVGLLMAYIIYSHYEHILKEQGFIQKFFLFIAFYWPLLIAVETTAYHLFNIHNIATAAYPGLPICDCIHAPHWMQFAYFAMGPIFFSICYALKLENPHAKVLKRLKHE